MKRTEGEMLTPREIVLHHQIANLERQHAELQSRILLVRALLMDVPHAIENERWEVVAEFVDRAMDAASPPSRT